MKILNKQNLRNITNFKRAVWRNQILELLKYVNCKNI